MTLREIAARIVEGGGAISRCVSTPRADGTCGTIWPGVTITQNQYFELLRMIRRAELTPEQARVMRAHDAAVGRHT